MIILVTSVLWTTLGPHGDVRILLSSGQICLNTRRIIIQRKIYREEFHGKFIARTNSLPAGDPLDPKPSSVPSLRVTPAD